MMESHKNPERDVEEGKGMHPGEDAGDVPAEGGSTGGEIPAGQGGPPEEESSYPGGDPGGGPDVEPGLGGYVGGRKGQSDMPAIPTEPDTQEDPQPHDAAPPSEGSDPPASN
jgi:hypothetical protein